MEGGNSHLTNMSEGGNRSSNLRVYRRLGSSMMLQCELCRVSQGRLKQLCLIAQGRRNTLLGLIGPKRKTNRVYSKAQFLISHWGRKIYETALVHDLPLPPSVNTWETMEPLGTLSRDKTRTRSRKYSWLIISNIAIPVKKSTKGCYRGFDHWQIIKRES